jgi:hypothetical protein
VSSSCASDAARSQHEGLPRGGRPLRCGISATLPQRCRDALCMRQRRYSLLCSVLLRVIAAGNKYVGYDNMGEKREAMRRQEEADRAAARAARS